MYHSDQLFLKLGMTLRHILGIQKSLLYEVKALKCNAGQKYMNRVHPGMEPQNSAQRNSSSFLSFLTHYIPHLLNTF